MEKLALDRQKEFVVLFVVRAVLHSGAMSDIVDDAGSSCGSNPGIFIGIRDLPAELSPLFYPEWIASSCILMGLYNRCVLFLWFERWYIYWNRTAGCRVSLSFGTSASVSALCLCLGSLPLSALSVALRSGRGDSF